MSVLIKGMEMPKSCDDCNFESIMCCFLLEKRLAIETFKKGERDKDCPLVEVPTPHGRLVDADALMEKKNTHIDVLADWRYVRVSTIEDAPTIIESEGE